MFLICLLRKVSTCLPPRHAEMGQGQPDVSAQPPQTQGFHSTFLANIDIIKAALLSGFLGKAGLILWFIFSSAQKEKIWRSWSHRKGS